MNESWKDVTWNGTNRCEWLFGCVNQWCAIYTMIKSILLACLPLTTALLISTSRTNYHVTSFTTPHSNASSYCTSLGMRLARLSESDFDQIKGGMEGRVLSAGSFWIDKWNGTNVIDGVERCLAFYKSGAIAVPSHSCEEVLGVICEESFEDWLNGLMMRVVNKNWILNTLHTWCNVSELIWQWHFLQPLIILNEHQKWWWLIRVCLHSKVNGSENEDVVKSFQ